jgi:hypothetical protein
MKRLLPILLILILAFIALVPMVAAQDTVSAGCTTIVGTVTDFTGEFSAGEQVILTGTGDFAVTVTVNGVVQPLVDVIAPDSFVYNINADGNYTFSIAGAIVTADCLSDAEVPDYPPGMICHFPPGNPDAAHTITVGSENAVQTHIDKHGDTLGPCLEGVDTRVDNPDANIVIFIIPADGTIELFSGCDDETCPDSTLIIIVEFIDFSLVVDAASNFIVVEEAIPFEVDGYEGVGTSLILYYLHPDPEDSTVGVFQVNVVVDGVTIDDSILIFIATDGTIVMWADQSIWDEKISQ